MPELIEREKALKNICKYCAEPKCKKNECMVYAGIKDTPAIEPEVRHGRWIVKGQEIYCSECNGESLYNTFGASKFSRFCPNCGSMNLEV